MEVLIPDEIRKDPKLAPAVDAISAYLRDDFKSPVLNPSARWKLRRDLHSNPVLDLEIVIGPELVSETFTPSELADIPEMQVRLRFLWDQLLNKTFERSQRRLTELLREAEESGV